MTGARVFWFTAVLAIIVFLEWRDEPFDVSEYALADFFAGAEKLPPVGTDAVLGRRQLRYCVFEEARLNVIGEEFLDFTLKAHFETARVDYDSRCSRYQYNVEERTPIRLRAIKDADEIRGDALQRVSRWQKEMASSAEFAASYRALRTGIVRLDTSAPEDARLIQRRLALRGFYTEPIDGDWGPQSEEALRTFKRKSRLGRSATWDITTQRRLFRDD